MRFLFKEKVMKWSRPQSNHSSTNLSIHQGHNQKSHTHCWGAIIKLDLILMEILPRKKKIYRCSPPPLMLFHCSRLYGNSYRICVFCNPKCFQNKQNILKMKLINLLHSYSKVSHAEVVWVHQHQMLPADWCLHPTHVLNNNQVQPLQLYFCLNAVAW